jgi:hypothetical protein
MKLATHPGSLAFALALASAVAVGVLAPSCGSAARHDVADVGIDAAGAADGGDDAAGGAAGASGASCQAIRLCIAAGQALDVCQARGTDAAQATFNALLTCLRTQPTPPCTGTDMGCTCREECYADGLCLDETSACVASSGATADGVCVQYCGG